jgi:integrase
MRPEMKPKGSFSVIEFSNPSGSISYRVVGTKISGERVRKHFCSEAAARAEKSALEIEALNSDGHVRLQATWLSASQLRNAEAAFGKIEHESELLRAVDYWNEHGRERSAVESSSVAAGVTAFTEWLDGNAKLRARTKSNLRTRVKILADMLGDCRLADVTTEQVQQVLDGRKGVAAATRDNDKRALSRFFSWCMERPRRWLKFNPCREVKVELGDKEAPAVLTLEACRKLMSATETFKEGRLAPYTAVCLFGKLRPFEARRVTREQINLKDNEIRLEGSQTKTGRPRVVTICATLKAWLVAYPGPIHPANWRKDFDKVKELAGLIPWVEDILRHTGVSHFFRKTGSYGLTAEESGNSEAIIKRHYQGRVSSDETKLFYGILPAKRKKRRSKAGRNCVQVDFSSSAATAVRGEPLPDRPNTSQHPNPEPACIPAPG